MNASNASGLHDDPAVDRIMEKAIKIARAFPQASAFGISGSIARKKTDKYSDYDFCVFTKDGIPGTDAKKNIYGKMGISSFDYFDIDFEISNGDGFHIDDFECGFIWMEYNQTLDLLKQLDSNWDLNEFLPGGIERVRTLFETGSEITNLKKAVHYSETRSINRFKTFIHRAHHSIYTLKWLEKAAFRNDYYSFLKNEFESIENLVYALFALNKRWMADEKRILELSEELPHKPENFANRLEGIILHKNENGNLDRCLKNIKQLFIYTIEVFQGVYKNERMNMTWQ